MTCSVASLEGLTSPQTFGSSSLNGDYGIADPVSPISFPFSNCTGSPPVCGVFPEDPCSKRKAAPCYSGSNPFPASFFAPAAVVGRSLEESDRGRAKLLGRGAELGSASSLGAITGHDGGFALPI